MSKGNKPPKVPKVNISFNVQVRSGKPGDENDVPIGKVEVNNLEIKPTPSPPPAPRPHRRVAIEHPAHAEDAAGPRGTPKTQYYLENPDVTPTYNFGPKEIPSKHVIVRTFLSYAFVNISPILRGHVLVAPLRCVKKVKQLTEAEAVDLFKTVRLVNRVLEKYYAVNSSTITIQDGPSAGQTVKHVHVHIIPRSRNDMDTRELYAKLAEQQEVKLRPPEEMAEEAAVYRQWFYKHDMPTGGEKSKQQGGEPSTPTLTVEHLLPSSGCTATTDPSTSSANATGHRCDCPRCQNIQCPQCTDENKKADVNENYRRSRDVSLPAKAETPSRRKRSLKTEDDEKPVSRLRRTRSMESKRRPQRGHPATEPSWVRTAFAVPFVGGMGASVVSVVKSIV